jgi:hypothetical protein
LTFDEPVSQNITQRCVTLRPISRRGGWLRR